MLSSPFDQEHLLHRVTSRIRQSLELQEILTTATEEIRAFLGVDRVKTYRFDADGSGVVIAESIWEQRLPSLLGLRFPAADVPEDARERFVKARQRVIIDVTSERKILSQLDCQVTGEPLSAEDIRYGEVDPCHVQYMTAMGVRASLTVPILHQQRLWGLFAIHHRDSRQFSEQELQVVQLLVDQVSIGIAQSSLLEQVKRQAHHESTINRISSLLHCPLSQPEIRQSVLEETVKALQGSGGRLYLLPEPGGLASQLYTTGEQPTDPNLEQHPLWQELMGGSPRSSSQHSTRAEAVHFWQQAGEVFGIPVSSSLDGDPGEGAEPLSSGLVPPRVLMNILHHPQLAPIVGAFRETRIRSALLIPLQYHHQCVGWMAIFRNGYDTEIIWAGQHEPDRRNHRPRLSFAAWRELKKDLSPEWPTDDVKLGQMIGIHVYMATMQRRVEELLRHEASHDPLTQLPNRLLFDEQLSLALVTCQHSHETLAVAFLDLDRFKTVNDTLGHAAGDQLLLQVTSRIKSHLRPCDILARWGGDEFTLLLPRLSSAEEARSIAQQILASLSIPFSIQDQELYISASLGVVLFPYDGEDAETLLKHADTAMYQAKQKGRNTYQFYIADMNHQTRERLELEADLRKAISKGELMLHFQPQVDLYTREVSSVEALLRWYHPHLGLVAPDQFIPLAEEVGLINTIGEWVIEQACFQHQAWCLQGLPPLRIAVNLSAQQFQRELVAAIVKILGRTNMDPQYLELEITESTAMKDVGLTIMILKDLRMMGVQIAMDDFGTGYSSLNAIKHLPLDTLKIDKSFVQDLMTDPSDRAIAQAVVALGRGLNLKILAEGVETLEQLDFLKSLGCDSAQGYLFSRPLSAPMIAQLLGSHVSASSPKNRITASALISQSCRLS